MFESRTEDVKHKIKVGRHELAANHPGLKLTVCGGVTLSTRTADVGDRRERSLYVGKGFTYWIIACSKRQAALK